MNNKSLIGKIVLWCLVFAAAAGSCLWVVFAKGDAIQTLRPFTDTQTVDTLSDSVAEPGGPAAKPDPKKDGPAAKPDPKKDGPAAKPDPKKDGPAAKPDPKKDGPAAGPAAAKDAPSAPKTQVVAETVSIKVTPAVEKVVAEPVSVKASSADKKGPAAKKVAPAAKPKPKAGPAAKKTALPKREKVTAKKPTASVVGPAPGTPGGIGSSESLKVDRPDSPIPTTAKV